MSEAGFCLCTIRADRRRSAAHRWCALLLLHRVHARHSHGGGPALLREGRAQRRQFVPFGRHGRLDRVSLGTAGQRHVDGTTRHETERTRRHRTRHHATEKTTRKHTQAQRAQHQEPGTPIRTNSPQHGSETTQRNDTNTTAPRRRNAPRDTTATERQRQAAPRASGRRRRPRALLYAGECMGSALVGCDGLSPAGSGD